ncbi:unnamed protein product [Closterium sp. Naga37s-1]|nr:unnamed protein product [Closterium sp. Naga37s-1]
MADEGKSVAKIIDGKAIAKQIHGEVAEGVAKLKEATGKVPGLAVIIVGERKDSQTYVRMKVKACQEVGIASFEGKLPGDASQDDVIAAVREFNANPDVHGILVQLPLPAHISEEAVLAEVALPKDVDGFHPINIGQLAMKGRHPQFAPCTPEGCMVLLERSGVQISGQRAVVIGRSNIVGMPAAMLLVERDATVTIVHSRTKEPKEIVKQADIVIAAIGRAQMVKGDWLKAGCAVIDEGINAVDDVSKKAGYRLVGDVDYEEAREVKADWLKPGCAVIDVGINAVDDASNKAGYRLVGNVDYEQAREAHLPCSLSSHSTALLPAPLRPLSFNSPSPPPARSFSIASPTLSILHQVKADWLKPGCAVIDVGINAVDDASKKAGYRLVGDVDYEGAREVAGWITPVPGGVGPMTIAVLLQHTLTAAQRALGANS